jgi:hypothetical protein
MQESKPNQPGITEDKSWLNKRNTYREVKRAGCVSFIQPAFIFCILP